MSVKKKWIAVLLAIAVLLGGLLWYLAGVARYREQVAAIVVEDIDFSTLANGVYEGSCDVGLVAARVRVTVENGSVTEIALLEHKNDRGAPAERLVGEIAERQTLAVDCVAGATNSSLVIRKAVENALREGGAE